MQKIDDLSQRIEADVSNATQTTLPPMHHEWPLLGQALYLLERQHIDASAIKRPLLSEQEQREKQEAFHNGIIAQLYVDEGNYSHDARHLAFLLLKAGRGGEIVGNSYALLKDGKKRELPYTGLEGYYAGSERTAERPGMTAEAILQEEANIGAELLGTLKKHAIEDYAWAKFDHLKQVLAKDNPDTETLRTLQLYWSTIVKRLHVRIYHNPEFELTLNERIAQVEQQLREIAGRTEEERRLKRDGEVEYARLKLEQERLGEAEQEQQRQETKRRERIRADRVAEFHRFRDETYEILRKSHQGHYAIEIQDTSLAQAKVVETITLPTIRDRKTYPRVNVPFTPEQYEGYLFLVKLGGIAGDPLTRSVSALL
jgi:hypothetical protein